MKVHHLNCGTMQMPTAPMVCHVLLVETDNGLVLVDSGFGTHDCDDPTTGGTDSAHGQSDPQPRGNCRPPDRTARVYAR